MKSVTKFQNKKVLVLGLAKSGTSSALLLHKLGAEVVAVDAKVDQSEDLLAELKGADVKIVLGENKAGNILEADHFDLIVKNPGIPYTNPILVDALHRKIKIISEPELAYQVLDSKLIGVTGSNGKTTVTTLINLMLNQDQQHAFVAGNIGIPATTVAQKATSEDTVVMELSSFMLAGIADLKPHIAIINNIFSNHLDWHKTRENYVNDKMNITKNQTADDFFVVNWDQDELQELSQKTSATIVPFLRRGTSKAGSYVEAGKIYFRDEYIMDIDSINIPGEQNVENALAAIAAAKLSNVRNESIVKVLKEFSGVKHRIQFVQNINNRIFYNDSKATDIEATEVALKSFEQPIILLAGGLDRGDDYSRLVPFLQKNVKEIIVNGQTASKMIEAAQTANIPVIKKSTRISESVKIAFQDSAEGDVILLSPAAASWDQYKNFEIRGDEFIQTVEKLL